MVSSSNISSNKSDISIDSSKGSYKFSRSSSLRQRNRFRKRKFNRYENDSSVESGKEVESKKSSTALCYEWFRKKRPRFTFYMQGRKRQEHRCPCRNYIRSISISSDQSDEEKYTKRKKREDSTDAECVELYRNILKTIGTPPEDFDYNFGGDNNNKLCKENFSVDELCDFMRKEFGTKSYCESPRESQSIKRKTIRKKLTPKTKGNVVNYRKKFRDCKKNGKKNFRICKKNGKKNFKNCKENLRNRRKNFKLQNKNFKLQKKNFKRQKKNFKCQKKNFKRHKKNFKITPNPFFNFMFEFREVNVGYSASAGAVIGAKLWWKLSENKKRKFRQMAKKAPRYIKKIKKDFIKNNPDEENLQEATNCLKKCDSQQVKKYNTPISSLEESGENRQNDLNLNNLDENISSERRNLIASCGDCDRYLGPQDLKNIGNNNICVNDRNKDETAANKTLPNLDYIS